MSAYLDGEVIKETFYLATNAPPTDPVFKSRLKICCGACSIKVLADLSDPDLLKNDIVGPHFFLDSYIENPVLKLHQFKDGDYQEVVILDDDTYGTLFPLQGADINDFGQNFIGYQLNFHKVIQDFGTGAYKIKCEFESMLGDGGVYYNREYCLNKYSEDRADKTFRLDYFQSGILGRSEDDLARRDYMRLNWHDSLRLRGVFYYGKSAYTNEYTQFNNGERPWVSNEQEPELKLIVKPICWNIHQIMRTDVMQSDVLLITDYNLYNFAPWINKSVQLTSEYDPQYAVTQSAISGVELTFRQSANNLKKFRS